MVNFFRLHTPNIRYEVELYHMDDDSIQFKQYLKVLKSLHIYTILLKNCNFDEKPAQFYLL